MKSPWSKSALPFLLVIAATAIPGAAAAGETAPYFAGASELKLTASTPMAVASHVRPALFAPASGGQGHSYYVFGIGKITEIRLDGWSVSEHAIAFDRKSDKLYDSGANNAWLGPDLRIYFGLQGKPARVGRFDPAAKKMELLGALAGHTVMRWHWGPDDRCYVITYPATLGEINAATGEIHDLGRLAPDALYVHSSMRISTDGFLYTEPGQRPRRKVRVNLKTGKIEQLEAFPEFQEVPPPKPDFPDYGKVYKVSIEADHDKAVITFRRKAEAKPVAVPFTCSTANRTLESIALGPDGKVYTCGSYEVHVFDPATKAGKPLLFRYNLYGYATVGSRLYFGGYPNARLGVLDTAQPLNPGSKETLWQLRKPEHNPREILNIYNVRQDPGDKASILKMKRAWDLQVAADGNIYVGCSATRQNRGGALVAYDPRTEQVVRIVREPFKLLGVPSVCAVNGGKTLALATWVSPDPRYPGEEPKAGKLFLFDVASGTIVHEAMPLPECKILAAVCQAPGKPLLAGIGLAGVEPSNEADDAFYGNGVIFLFDLRTRRTVLRRAFAFPLNRRTGRPIVAAPDGSLWISGGGGIIRVDPGTRTVAPLARVGADGNFVFVGRELYMATGPGIAYGDISALLR